MSSDQWEQPSEHFRVNAGIMVVAVIGLILIVALVFFLPFYTRCVLRRQARILAMQQMAQQAGATQVEVMAGLDPAVITTLPFFPYRKGGGPAPDCAVCLRALVEEEMVRALPDCMHAFHAECIDSWLNSHSTCPICRIEVGGHAHAQAEEDLERQQ